MELLFIIVVIIIVVLILYITMAETKQQAGTGAKEETKSRINQETETKNKEENKGNKESRQKFEKERLEKQKNIEKEEDLRFSWIKNRIDYIFKEFNEKQLKIKDDYIPIQKPVNFTEKELEKLFYEMKEHIEIRSQLIFLIRKEDEQHKDKAGFFEQTLINHKAINVIIHPDYDLNDYIAIMGHELAHCFMDENGLRNKDVNENEKKTDLIAIFLGFGMYMIKAYVTKISISRNLRRQHKLGYLGFDEAEYSYKKIKILKEQTKKDLIEKEKILYLENKYKTLLEIYSLFKNGYIEIKKLKDLPFNDFNIFFEISKENENNLDYVILNIPNEIEELKKDSSKFQDLNMNIEQLCTMITKWNAIISKYL